ncbi:MAG: non-ribosomal peptide synthetase, partial [bacterium]|nr:non-ribosomal peptide synthetase [bacterium]
YPLTPMQEGMLYHSFLEKSSVYLGQASYRLHARFDIPLVEKSLNRLFKRYDILRTAFIHEDLDRPMQVVLKDREVDFYFQDLRTQTAEDQETFIKQYREKDINRVFDLSNEPLLRVAVVRLGEDRYEFTWTNHHILIDGWCLSILIADFFEIYRGFTEHREPRLPAVNPYKKYIRWLENLDMEENKRYWKNYLEDYQEAAYIGTMKYRQGSDETYRHQAVYSTIDIEKSDRLNQLASRNRVTLNNLFRVVWGILLGKYTRKRDVLFGAVVSGRPSEIEGVESMVGLFINTIPVRIRFQGQTSFKKLLQDIQDEAVNSEANHHYPLIKIQAESLLKRDLLDHIFIFENFPITTKMNELIPPGENEEETGAEKESPGNEDVSVGYSAFGTSGGQTNYDFNVKVEPGKKLVLSLSYNANVYEKEAVQRILEHFDHVFDQVISDETINLNEITLLSAEEKKQVLYDFN